MTVGDFDGDGRMDIVASNWGRNSKYEKDGARGSHCGSTMGTGMATG